MLKESFHIALILDGNSEIGANSWSEISNLTCLSICLDRQQLFLKGTATSDELPSYVSTMACPSVYKCLIDNNNV